MISSKPKTCSRFRRDDLHCMTWTTIYTFSCKVLTTEGRRGINTVPGKFPRKARPSTNLLYSCLRRLESVASNLANHSSHDRSSVRFQEDNHRCQYCKPSNISSSCYGVHHLRGSCPNQGLCIFRPFHFTRAFKAKTPRA